MPPKQPGRRKLPDFLSAYLHFTENSEPPLSFHTWVALSCISGALQRKVYMKWGHSTIYPNQYIILVGPSGQSRKGEAINIGKSLLLDVAIPTTAERVTREALIRFMKTKVTNFTDPSTRRITFQSAVTCISEELSVFLGQREIGMLSDLTNWYDSRDEWTYETKNSGTDRVMGMCFNMLGGTAPDWLPSMLPQEAVGGGFTSRCIFVVEEHKRKVVSNPNLSGDEVALRDALLHDLEAINLLAGEVRFSAAAQQRYEEWYKEEEAKYAAGKAALMDPRFAGYSARRATHIKKIAMAVMASRGDDLIISENDFARARGLLEAVERKMPRVFIGLGKARFAEATETVLLFVQSRREVSRAEVLRRYYRDVDAYTLDQVEVILSQMGMVQVLRNGTGERLYKYSGPTDLFL